MKRPIFVGSSFFFLKFLFSVNCFPRLINLKHASAVYARHKQVLTNTKNTLLKSFFGTVH